MPVYEFRCEKCQKEFEELLNISNYSRVVCPECNSKKVKKLISTFGFKSGSRFKSSGNKDSSCSHCESSSCRNCK